MTLKYLNWHWCWPTQSRVEDFLRKSSTVMRVSVGCNGEGYRMTLNDTGKPGIPRIWFHDALNLTIISWHFWTHPTAEVALSLILLWKSEAQRANEWVLLDGTTHAPHGIWPIHVLYKRLQNRPDDKWMIACLNVEVLSAKKILNLFGKCLYCIPYQQLKTFLLKR